VIVLKREVLLFQCVCYKFAIFVCAYTHTCVCARVSERVYARVCALTHAHDVSFSLAKAPYKCLLHPRANSYFGVPMNQGGFVPEIADQNRWDLV